MAAAIVGLLVQPLRGVLSGWRAVPGLLIGDLSLRGLSLSGWRAIPGLLIGTIVIYLIGVPWLAVSASMDLLTAITKGMLPFIPGDLIKVAVAAAVLPSGMTALRSLGWPLRGPAGNADDTT